jgi:lipopolysaccharide export system permease protein
VFKILDQYLFKLFVKNYLFSLLILATLFLIIDVITILNRFQVPGHIYLAYYINYTPWVISQMMPIAGVLSTVFLFVSLQKNNELVVFYSLGVSIYRVLAPLMCALLLVSIFCWLVTDKVVPSAMDKRNYYYYVKMKENPASYNKLKKNDIWFRTPRAIVNFKKLLSQGEVSGGRVYFYANETWRPTRVLEAKKIFLKKEVWIFENGVETLYENDRVTTIKFDKVTTSPLEDLSEFEKRQSRVESMTLSELSYAIEKGQEASMSTNNLETEYHGKLSFIFSALFLSLLALPFCIGNTRSSNVFVGLGVALVLVILYWVAYSFCLSMGRTGVVPAMIAAWLPGFVSVAAFGFLIRKQRY